MNLRKMLTKITVLSIVSATAILPMSSFASEIPTDTKSGNPFIANTKIDPQEKILALATEYTPESVAQWESLFLSKDTIRSEITSLKIQLDPLIEGYRLSIKDSFIAEKDAFVADLRAQIENGDLTTEEAAAIYETQKNQRTDTIIEKKAERELIKAQRAAERQTNKTERKALGERLRLSVSEENDAQIILTLNNLLALALEAESKGYTHIENLEAKLVELSTL